MNQDQDRAELLQILETESAYRRKAQRSLNVVIVSVLGLSAASLGYLIAVKGDTSTLAMMGGLVAIFGMGIGMRPAHKLAAEQAAKLADPTIAGYLCELLDNQEIEMKKLIEEALATSLTKVEPSHAVHFNANTRRLLCLSIATTSNPSFADAAVHALGQIGTLEELATLEKIAATSVMLPMPEDKERVANRASMAMAHIRMREAKVRIDAADPMVAKPKLSAVPDSISDVVEGSA